MAKYETTIHGDFSQILHRLEDGILDGSVSASVEDASDFCSGDARCSVRVFERYSYTGGNRVSLTLTLFQCADEPFTCQRLQPVAARRCSSSSIPLAKKHFWIS